MTRELHSRVKAFIFSSLLALLSGMPVVAIDLIPLRRDHALLAYTCTALSASI
jgi:hypothetical protein